MARVKISELNAKTTAEDTDLIPIVDTTSTETKKITKEDLFQDHVAKAEFAVVSATVTTPETGSGGNGQANIDYPTGFNNENCVIVSLMAKVHTTAEIKWATTSSQPDTRSLTMGNYDLVAQLKQANIFTYMEKINASAQSQQIDIRIVLMKLF